MVRRSSAQRLRPASGISTTPTAKASSENHTLGGLQQQNDATESSERRESLLTVADSEMETVHPLAPQRLRLTVLLDVWARVEREFLSFPTGLGGSRDFSSGTQLPRPIVADQSVYQGACEGYMDCLQPTIARLRAVDAVAGTSMLQQFAFIGATLRAGVQQCKIVHSLTSRLYRMLAFWVSILQFSNHILSVLHCFLGWGGNFVSSLYYVSYPG